MSRGTLEVQTTKKLHKFTIATRYEITWNENNTSFLTVYGDDDFEDGEIELRVFNLDKIVDYGWVR